MINHRGDADKMNIAEELDALDIKTAELIYENALNAEDCIRDYTLEGKAKISFENKRLRLENELSASLEQKANYVLWCDKDFPPNIMITWNFYPIREPGLAMIFFAAQGRKGEDIFAESLQRRTGEYGMYHHGDINAFHISYFRRKEEDERAFHTCNLRKSYGFYMAAQGADPIPDVADVRGPYEMIVIKYNEHIIFKINGLEVLHYIDDGMTYGPRLQGGYIGFRQLAPMVAEYSNLRVYAL